MGFRFERRARPRKARGIRSWLGKPPDAREVNERLRRLLPRTWKDAEVTVAANHVRVAFESFAPPLRIAVTGDGEIAVTGELAAVGPGYCDDAAQRMAPVLDELDYAWADDAAPERPAMLAWLADELRGGATRIGMPDGRRFTVDASVQTALGPRDAAWRDAVLADPAAGRDAFAWWDHGPGQLERARALLAMWHEVPWRAPVDKAERAAMKRVDADLRAARRADPALALPYAEWAELAGFLGDDDRAAELRGRATGPAAIGYRRFDMVLEVGGGWSIALPGAFVGRWEDDGERYWATDGRRVVEIASFDTAEGDAGWLIDAAPPLHDVIERLDDGARRGRAEAFTDGDDHIVQGVVAVAPHVALLTIHGAETDRAWALATWRSLQRT